METSAGVRPGRPLSYHVPDVAVPSDVGFFIGQLDTSDKNAPLYGSILEFLGHIFINFTRERVKRLIIIAVLNFKIRINVFCRHSPKYIECCL